MSGIDPKKAWKNTPIQKNYHLPALAASLMFIFQLLGHQTKDYPQPKQYAPINERTIAEALAQPESGVPNIITETKSVDQIHSEGDLKPIISSDPDEITEREPVVKEITIQNIHPGNPRTADVSPPRI